MVFIFYLAAWVFSRRAQGGLLSRGGRGVGFISRSGRSVEFLLFHDFLLLLTYFILPEYFYPEFTTTPTACYFSGWGLRGQN